MPVQKLAPRSLNLDDDYLVVKPTEMVDAFNIEVAADENGNANVLKAIQGTTPISFAAGSALPAGTNTVIGSGLNTEKNEIVYAVWNSNGDHSIYVYSTSTGVCKLVYRDSILAFTQTTFVKFDFLVKQNGDTIAYFTDGNNEPKKINITKATGVAGYPYKTAGAYSYTSDEKLLSITSQRQAPLTPPSATFARVGDEDGFVYDEYFQFAYQYVYEDGEVSAISPYSELSLNTYHVLEDFVGYEAKSYYNTINVTVRYSLADVSKIKVLARSSSGLGFFQIGELNNVRSASTTTLAFTNSKLRAYIAESEQNKMYDSVPRKANAQAISSNRLLYAGYTEFFDNVAASVSMTEIPKAEGVNVPISVTPTTGQSVSYNPVIPAITSKFNIVVGDTLNAMPDSSEVLLDFKISGTPTISFGSQPQIVLTPNESTYELIFDSIEFNIIKRFNIPAYTSLTSPSPDIYSYFINNVIGNYEVVVGEANADLIVSGDNHSFKGTAVINVSLDAVNYGSTQVSFIVKIVSLTLETASGISGTTGEPIPPSSFISFTLNPTLLSTSYITDWIGFRAFNNYNSRQYYNPSIRTFKSGQHHKFGIVYYDLFNRSGAVNEIGDKEITFLSDREYDVRGAAAIQFKLLHNPPSWAKKWQLVYAPFSSYSFSLQHSVTEAFSNTTDPFIYVSTGVLEGKPYSYKDSKGAKLEYSFVEGDKLRLIRYENAGSIEYVSYEFDILAYEFFDGNNTPISASVSADRKTGWFLKLRDNAQAVAFSKASIESSSDGWNNKAIVEIYRPVKQADVSIYREISEVYDVVYDSGAYKHKGERDFSYTWTSGPSNITILEGVATTSLDIRSGDTITISHTVLGSPEIFEVRVGAVKTYGAQKKFSVANANIVGQLSNSIPSNDNYSLANISGLSFAIIETSNGDAYYRPRKMVVAIGYPGSGNVTTSTSEMFIEDNSVSDFKVSNVSVVGRPNAASPTAIEVYRKASITYSEPYAIDSSVLTLSSFNTSLANFNDYANKYGAIKYIHSNDDSLFVLQERKASIIPVGRNMVEYADGGASLTVSNNVLGIQNFYAGEYGVNDNPESAIERDGRLYFCDVVSGKVLRIGGDGITPISDYGVGSFIAKNFNDIDLSATAHKVVSYYNPDKDYYMFSTFPLSGSGISLTMSFDVTSNTWISKHSFYAEGGLPLGDSLMSFKNGTLYKHSDDATFGVVYGNNCTPSFAVVANENASMVKTFKSLSIEANKPFGFYVTNTSQDTNPIAHTVLSDSTSFILNNGGQVIGYGNQQFREGVYYSEIPRDREGYNNSIIVIGEVASVSGNLATFTSKISDIPFELNKTVQAFNGSSWTGAGITISSIFDSKTLAFNTSVNSSFIGQTFGVDGSTDINGNPIRDRHCVVWFSNPTTGKFELYAVNINYSESKSHFA